jgi:hypothetical protein
VRVARIDWYWLRRFFLLWVGGAHRHPLLWEVRKASESFPCIQADSPAELNPIAPCASLELIRVIQIRSRNYWVDTMKKWIAALLLLAPMIVTAGPAGVLKFSSELEAELRRIVEGELAAD